MSFRVSHDATSQSLVLHERGWRRYETESPGAALSIKCMFGGFALYQTRQGLHRVDDAHYLVLNHATPYTITIDAPEPVESFCVFFAPGFAEEVLRVLATPDDRLLANPDGPGGASVGFFECTYPHDRTLSPSLLRLRMASAEGQRDEGWWGEHLHGLAARMLAVHRGAHRGAALLAAVRPATRAEIYRRLRRARDCMDACLDRPLPLVEVASVAGMAPHHLLRTFRQAFGSTPHQYLIRQRLERAKKLLATTEMPVTEVCLEVGFTSLGSFSSLFRRRAGLSPASYRIERRGRK